MASLTAFIVGNGAVSDEIRVLVESWTRAGILEPSLWITPEDVAVQPAGPPIVRATYVHTGGVSEVDLFEHVGRLRLDVMRLVAAHFITHETEPNTALAQVATIVADAVQSTLPQRVDDSEASREVLHRTLLVIPVSGAAGADPALFQPGWNVNAVIAPEDRPDLDRASVFVRYPGNFAGHASSALSAVGGILRGVGSGVLDEIDTDSTTQDGDILVARISVRSVIGEDVLDAISARVLDSGSVEKGEPADLLSWARPASQPEATAASAASHILSSDEWSSRPMPSGSNLRVQNESIGAAIRSAIKFNFATTGAVLSWLMTFGRERAERQFTSAIAGDKAGVLVTLGARPAADMERVSEQLIAQEQGVIDQELQMQSTRVLAPAPSTWESLRKLAFSLVDGGELENFPEPRQANKRELLQPEFIVSANGKKWVGLKGKEVPASDPIAMRTYSRELDAALAETKAERAKIEAALVIAEAAVEAEEAARVKAEAARIAAVAKKAKAESEPESDNDAPAAESEARALTAKEKAVARLRLELTTATNKADEITREQGKYGAWYKEVSSSLVWRIADDVGRRSFVHGEAQTSIAKLGKSETPPSDALKGSQKLLRIAWGASVGVLLLVAGLFVYLRYGDLGDFRSWRLTTDQMIVALAVDVVIFLAIVIVSNHFFYHAVRRYEREVEEQISRLRRIKDSFVYAGQEKQRLDNLYGTLGDWATIMSEAIHKPWSPVEDPYQEISDAVVAALPASMGVARQASTHNAIPTNSLLDAAEIVYPRGWVSRQFDAAYEAWENDQSSGSGEGYRSVDLDTSESATSPRHRLREFYESGDASTVVTARSRRTLRSAVNDGSFELPERVVGRIGRYSDGNDVGEPDFYRVIATENTTFATDLFAPAALQKRMHYVARSFVWLPNGARSIAPDGSLEFRQSSGATAVRVDISRRVEWTELTTFAGGRQPSESPVTVHTPQEDSAGDEFAWH